LKDAGAFLAADRGVFNAAAVRDKYQIVFSQIDVLFRIVPDNFNAGCNFFYLLEYQIIYFPPWCRNGTGHHELPNT
jgi:hypothetical protein